MIQGNLASGDAITVSTATLPFINNGFPKPVFSDPLVNKLSLVDVVTQELGSKDGKATRKSFRCVNEPHCHCGWLFYVTLVMAVWRNTGQRSIPGVSCAEVDLMKMAVYRMVSSN